MKESNHDMFFGSWYNLQDGSGIYAIVNSSVMDAARAVGNPKISRVGIKRCYQGRQKSAYGYIWKLKIQEND